MLCIFTASKSCTMKRRYSIIPAIMLLCVSFNIEARTIKDFFISEPGNLLSLISKSSRMDMIDYYNDGRMVDIKNAMGGTSHFIHVNDRYISLQTSNSSTLELLLQPISKNDSIIVAITTCELPAKDSRIVIYNTNWKPLDATKHFRSVKMEDFIRIPKGDKTKKQTVLDAIEFPIISYSINPENHSITAHHGLKEYMSKEDYQKISPYLTDSIVIKLK